MSVPRVPQAENRGEITALNLLTRRERQVASLIALGHTNLEVGSLLRIHQKTVETHRNHLMTKLGLRTRADLVRFALAQGLVSNGPGGRFFQSCTGCRVLWQFRSQFLSDRDVTFRGFEPVDAAHSPGVFVFQHERCGTRITIALEIFVELAGEPLLAAGCGPEKAPAGHCLAKANSQACPLRCICAFVWRTSQILNHWPKG